MLRIHPTYTPGTSRDASAPGVRFDLLGPLVVRHDDRPLRLGSVKQRLLLATLLARPNEAVRIAELTRALWAGEPPPSAAANLRTYVLGIRRTVGARDGVARLPATAGGYLLRVENGERDVDHFDAAATRGRACLDAGDAPAAEAELSRALGHWRGAPLDGLPLPSCLEPWAGRLLERRLLVEEDHAEAMLALGADSEAVRCLRPLVESYPLRQRAWGHLMLGLYRVGDVAGALEAFRQARTALAEQAGLDLGPDLTRLHDDILHNSPALTERARAHPHRCSGAAPDLGWFELPPAVEPLVGRRSDLATLLSWTGGAEGPVIALHGPGGVGKSALAVRAARAMATSFPGGALYADLRGADADHDPARPTEALGRFLRALGVPDSAVPPDVDEAAAAYRRELAGRRVLVVLDNAHNAAQVAPLLPADPTCAVVVTSRRRLATLSRARHFAVEPLTAEDSATLLAAAGAGPRATAEPAAARRLAGLCDHLPLALCAAGARLASRPQWSLGTFADRLGDPTQRLDELCYDDLCVRDALRPAYTALRSGTEHERLSARVFRLLGVVPVSTITVGAAAALVGRPPDRTRRLLDTLADHRLLEPHQAGRYVLLELPQIYAHERARDEETTAERDAALRRLTYAYLAVAEHAEDLAQADGPPPLPAPSPTTATSLSLPATATDVTRWLTAEHRTIGQLFTQAGAAEGDLPELAVRLARACGGLCARHGYPATARALIDGAVDLAERLGLTAQHIAALFDRARLRADGGDVHGALTDLLDCARTVDHSEPLRRRTGAW